MPILIIGPNPYLTLSVTPIVPSFEHLPRQCPEGVRSADRKLQRRGAWNPLRMAKRLLSAKGRQREL
jgi:hypothetical protein